MQDHVITRAVFSGLFSVCRLKIGRGPLLGKAIEFFTAQGGHTAGDQRALLEAWTSAIEMDVLSSGALVNRRMDLLVGSFSRGGPFPDA